MTEPNPPAERRLPPREAYSLLEMFGDQVEGQVLRARQFAEKQAELSRLQARRVLRDWCRGLISDKELLKQLNKLHLAELRRMGALIAEHEKIGRAIDAAEADPAGAPPAPPWEDALVDDAIFSPEARRMTVVQVDLVESSKLYLVQQQVGSSKAVQALSKALEALVKQALTKLGSPAYAEAKLENKGDLFLLGFGSAARAHRFGVALHRICQARNAAAPPANQLWFRTGLATGEVEIVDPGGPGLEPTSYTILLATRLMQGGRPGVLFIDPATYDELPDELRALYVEDAVPGKGHEAEPFRAYRHDIPPAG